MDRIFNMDNKFFTFMGRLADLVILNLGSLTALVHRMPLKALLGFIFFVNF